VLNFEFGCDLSGAVVSRVRDGNEASFRHLTTNVFCVPSAHFANAENADS